MTISPKALDQLVASGEIMCYALQCETYRYYT